jgi:hypothetical protein
MTDKTETSVEELNDKLNKALASIEKLTTKNAELIEREKKAKLKADEAEDARETAAEEAARKGNDLEALEKSLERKYSKQIADLTAANEASTKQLNALVIDGGIKDALTANGVTNPVFAKAVTAMLKADATLKDGVGLVGDQPIADFAKAFLTGDEGKHFVSAPNNTGAGATGSTSTRPAHTFTKETFDTRIGEWAALAKSDPALAKSIAQQVGRDDLASDL